jgi:hypothetical protein
MGVVLNCISLMSSELMTGAFLARAIVGTLTCRKGASGPPLIAPYPVCLGANKLSLQWFAGGAVKYVVFPGNDVIELCSPEQ